jgi:hypothetical protein
MESVLLTCMSFNSSINAGRFKVIKAPLTDIRVSHVTYNTDEATAVFTAHQIEWNEAYAATKVDFGMTGMSPSRQYSISGLRFHDNLRRRLGRRQAAASSTFTYPSAPTSTPSSESSVQNINYSKTNTSIISTDEFIVGCTNCTLAGVLDITHGTFTVNGSATNEIERVTQFIKDGFFSAVANDVSARIELDTTILLMASKSFSQNIFTIALPGFQVCAYWPVSLFYYSLVLVELQYKTKTLMANEMYRSQGLLR